MKVIARECNTGKTEELIRECHKNGGYIVCHSHHECVRISREAEEMGCPIPFPLTYREFISGDYSESIPAFYIDDLEMLINSISRVRVAAVTVRMNSETWETEPMILSGAEMSRTGIGFAYERRGHEYTVCIDSPKLIASNKPVLDWIEDFLPAGVTVDTSVHYHSLVKNGTMFAKVIINEWKRKPTQKSCSNCREFFECNIRHERFDCSPRDQCVCWYCSDWELERRKR